MAGSGTESAAHPQWRGGSIRSRLPLLIAGLLAISVAAFGLLAYREVERSFLTAARERVQNVARQLSQLLGGSVQPRVDETRRLAARPSVRTLLTAHDSTQESAVRSDIAAFLKTSPQTLAVDVWDTNGTRVLAYPAPPAAGATPVPAAALVTERPGAAGFTALRDHGGDLITYDVIGVVTSEDPAPGGSSSSAPAIGYIAIRRRASTAGAAAMVERLLGGNMLVQFGTRTGGVWTDLSKVTPAPPSAVLGTPGASEYVDATGAARIGAASTVAGTPWLIWVSMTRANAVSGGAAFLQRLGLLGLSIIVVGAAIGWWLAGRVTTPLVGLTHAAEAIAGGDFSRRVPGGPSNEVGRLGHAFNVMASKVEDGYAKLDARVKERTQAVEDTMVQLREAQEALVRREKLAMLGQLASGVGHELRNPLGVMTNAVFYLEMVQPDAAEEVREYHGILKSQIGLAERIVSDLLDFSRIRPPQRQEVSLARLVDDQLVRLGKVEGVSVVREVPDDLPSADIDPMQIGQVVLNLLLNAAQAMEASGGVLTVRGRVTDEGVALDVLDTGPGVPADLQEKIFEALFTTKARGIGLGLSVSRSLALANAGALTVSSAPGGGAMFTLVLPAVRAEVAT